MDKNIISPSIPPINRGGGTIGKIVKAVKKLLGIFKGTSKETGQTESNDSIENIERVIHIFSCFKEQVHQKSIEIEKSIQNEVGFYLEELHDILSENDDKVIKYGIQTKRIERSIDRISSRVNGTIDNELSKRISMDNNECKNIMKMIPGSKKEAAMNDFLIKSIKEVLNICCTEMHTSLDDIYDDVEIEVIGAVYSIQKQIEKLQESLSYIEETNYEETARTQLQKAYYCKEVCDLVTELL